MRYFITLFILLISGVAQAEDSNLNISVNIAGETEAIGRHIERCLTMKLSNLPDVSFTTYKESDLDVIMSVMASKNAKGQHIGFIAGIAVDAREFDMMPQVAVAGTSYNEDGLDFLCNYAFGTVTRYLDRVVYYLQQRGEVQRNSDVRIDRGDEFTL